MPDKEEYYTDDDQANLREIFAILKRWKKTIIGVTLACMLAAGLFTCLIIEPVYESQVKVAAAVQLNTNLPSKDIPFTLDAREGKHYQLIEEIDRSVRPPQGEVANFNTLLTSNQVIKSTLKRMHLEENPAKLLSQIKVKADQKTNTVVISVSRNNPEQAANIANILVEEALQLLDKHNAQRLQKTKKDLEKNIKLTEQVLDQEMTELAAATDNRQTRQIRRKIRNQEEILDILIAKVLEIDVLQSFQNDHLVVLSPASPSPAPLSPNLKINVAIAGVLGLMLSVLGVFLAEYLREEEA